MACPLTQTQTQTDSDKVYSTKIVSLLEKIDIVITVLPCFCLIVFIFSDFGASHEKTETLGELVTAKHSPWNIDYSWSDEARQLREIAVRSPWLVDKNFVLRHFRTLRIVDKGVSQFACTTEPLCKRLHLNVVWREQCFFTRDNKHMMT